ncbi:hypothetical protein Enr13x_77060 [Stieleria neptunia]|uniref:Uncharacterized protein n=1 Tax=Stieleria neptunia TaxID=2527979 RepID=A0A518I3Z1_9BACT|nr:hypothetical protein Enr13x_77060 [Stieleria neptunia]
MRFEASQRKTEVERLILFSPDTAADLPICRSGHSLETPLTLVPDLEKSAPRRFRNDALVDATDCAKKSRFLCSVRSHSFILAPFSPAARASGARSRRGGEGLGMRGHVLPSARQSPARSGAARQQHSSRPRNREPARRDILPRPNIGRDADHADGLHWSDEVHHQPQQSTSRPHNRSRLYTEKLRIRAETSDFDTGDCATFAKHPEQTRLRGPVDRERRKSPLDPVELFCSCCPYDSRVTPACPLIPNPSPPSMKASTTRFHRRGRREPV